MDDKISVTITLGTKEITVSISDSMHVTIDDVLADLIVPALLGIGYQSESIDDAFESYVDNLNGKTHTAKVFSAPNTEPDYNVEPPEFDIVSEGFGGPTTEKEKIKFRESIKTINDEIRKKNSAHIKFPPPEEVEALGSDIISDEDYMKHRQQKKGK
jgi:hypothetical protein